MQLAKIGPADTGTNDQLPKKPRTERRGAVKRQVEPTNRYVIQSQRTMLPGNELHANLGFKMVS